MVSTRMSAAFSVISGSGERATRQGGDALSVGTAGRLDSGTVEEF
jgi:hypothetical protein